MRHQIAFALFASFALAQGPGSDARRLQVLFFGAPTGNGPHHDPITRYRTLKKGLGVDGIDFTYSESPTAALTPDNLAQFDAVLMYGNWAQNEPMPRPQLTALLSYVDRGGGFVPVHCASACFGGSPLFVKLVGARFATHGGEEFALTNALPDHPILQGLPGFRAWDETYVHKDHADDRTILQTRDGEPWSWTRTQGQGRVFYTASGHDHRVWDLPQFQSLLRNAIYWAVGPQKKQRLDDLRLPRLETEAVSLPGYRQRKEITVAQKPLSAAESMKLAQVPIGMTLSLFASEPDIVNPIHCAWDHRGRAFVVETIDYPDNLQAGNLGHDRITICDDTDGDGRADRFTRFAEQLSIPTSIAFANGGVLCTNGSELLHLVDTDGDDRADVRKVLFSGFHMGDTHAGVSNLRTGFDGWVWATVGYSGFAGEVGDEHHDFGQAVFRFRANGQELEVLQNTTNNTWGLGFSEAFDVVGSTANGNPSWYLTFPRRTYERAGMDAGRTPAADDNPMFFPSSTDIRQVDQFDRYTSAAGHAFYTARRLPADYHDRIAFVTEPTGKLVGQFAMERHGAGFRAMQQPNNLYNSADAWSAPVAAEVGPDGAVWICDWYNLIVQHNPTPSRASAGVDARTGKGNAYETPLRDKRHGRIYRVFPTGSANDPLPHLDPRDPVTLLAGLSHTNLLWRLHAARLLAERNQADIAPQLATLATKDDPAAPHAVWLLARFNAFPPEGLAAALKAPRESARRAAIANATPADLKTACIANGTIAARGRELAEILVGLAGAAADPELGAAVFAVAQQLGGEVFEERALRDAWTMAARSQRDGVLAAARAAGIDFAAKEEATNVLPNPGFEQLDGNMPTGWNDVRRYGGAEVSARVVDGGRSGKCLEVASERRSDSGVAAVVRLERGARYRLSGFVKTKDVAPSPRAPGVMFNIHGGRAITRGVTGNTDWTELHADFEAGDESEVTVHCLFGGYGGASGTAWFDDVALVKIAGGATLPGALATLAQDVGATATAAPVQREFQPDPVIHARGQEVYARTCIACHGIDGKGVPGAFPPLDGSDWLTGDPDLSTRIVLHGLMGPIQVGDGKFNSVMAPLGPQLDDQQIADVLTFVRQRWANDAATVTKEQVAKTRAATKDRALMWTAGELGR
ncbi:MAG: ThuA domain-containing protein [Planctomycetes bacterium]|nr:ThuA domain-containing protein [Planctomycetota bacterium]